MASLNCNADDILADLIEGEEAEKTEREALMAEARRHVFGREDCPPISLDDKLGAVWRNWQDRCEKVNAWEAGHDKVIGELKGGIAGVRRGKGWQERTLALRDQIAHLQWRRNAARHVLYCDYPAAQEALRAFLRACWEESGVTHGETFWRLDEFAMLCSERRALEWASDKTLLEVAAIVATESAEAF